MAAYSLDDVLTHAQVGEAVKITLNTFRTDWVGSIGGQKVWLGEQQECVTLTNGVRTATYTNNIVLDLGTKFTAKQILDSLSLRNAIIDGVVIAEAGTQAISLDPVLATASP